MIRTAHGRWVFLGFAWALAASAQEVERAPAVEGPATDEPVLRLEVDATMERSEPSGAGAVELRDLSPDEIESILGAG